MLALEDPASAERTRWRIAVAGVDRLLTDAGVDLTTKRDIVASSRNGRARNLAVQPTAKQLAAAYRPVRAVVDRILRRDYTVCDVNGPLECCLSDRSERSASAWSSLRQRVMNGNQATGFTAIIGSIVHMHVNRVLASEHNRTEFLIYDYLTQSYTSRLARERSRPVSPGVER